MNRVMRVPLIGVAALLACCGQNVNGPATPIRPRSANLTIAAEKLTHEPVRGICGVRVDGSESCTYYVYVRVVVAEHAGGGAHLRFVELEMHNRATGRSEMFHVSGTQSEPPGTGRVPPFGALAVHGRAEYTFEVGAPWETRDLTVRGHLMDGAGINHILGAELRSVW